MHYVNNVTIKNMKIEVSQAIWLESCSNITISGNNLNAYGGASTLSLQTVPTFLETT